MKSILLGATAMAVLAFAPTAWAQNRPQQQQRPAQAAPAPSAPAAPAQAAPAAATPAPAIPPQNQARVSGWVSRCVTNARAAAPECVTEQNMVLVSSGQAVMTVVIRIAPENRAPQLQVQLPHGTYLPAGVKLRTDTGVGLDLAFQMCDARGCFTGNPITPELLAALKTAKRLDASVQNMGRETQLLSMPMDGFAAAYERVQ
jgi:invasion protein IalB